MESLKLHLTYLNITVLSYHYMMHIVVLPEEDIYAVACAVTHMCSMPSSLELYDGSVNVTWPVGKSADTGADTVSLLSLGRKLASAAECETYAAHGLWLWNLYAGRTYMCVCVYL